MDVVQVYFLQDKLVASTGRAFSALCTKIQQFPNESSVAFGTTNFDVFSESFVRFASTKASDASCEADFQTLHLANSQTRFERNLMKLRHTLAVALAIFLGQCSVHAQVQIGSEFTYQGQLQQNGQAADGLFDMSFRLFSVAGGGTSIDEVMIPDVTVTNGRFTVELDFGFDAFDGHVRWLEIEVDNETLSPRQKITASPYSLYSTKTRGVAVNSDASFVGVGRDAPVDDTEVFGIEAQTGSGPTAFGGMYVRSTGSLSNAYYGYDSGTLFTGRHWIDGVIGGWRLESTVISSDETVELLNTQRNGNFRTAIDDSGSPHISVANDQVRLGSRGSFDWRMYVMPSGYVGIGRDEPVVDTTLGQSWLDVDVPANGDQIGAMYINNNNPGSRSVFGYAVEGVSKAVMTYDDSFNTWSLDIGPNVIDEISVNGNNGRVGISTVSPTALLDVNGSGRVRSNMDVDLSLDVGQNLFVNGNAFKPGGGFWSNLSDARLKKNIKDLADGTLEKVLSLRGVNYEYKDPKSINELAGERTGFIAQEVEKVFPDWVEQHDSGYKMLTIRGFEAIVVEAIRELRDEKDKQIVELEAENEDLRDRLDALEAAVAELLAK